MPTAIGHQGKDSIEGVVACPYLYVRGTTSKFSVNLTPCVPEALRVVYSSQDIIVAQNEGKKKSLLTFSSKFLISYRLHV